ncbi:MAG: ABC transporter ATP-binding protein [Oscillospiraceae bacterium]
MKTKAIEIDGLVKHYGSVQAVQGTSFYVEEGHLFALLGENGAGKSTTIDILSTLLAPDAGTALVGGLQIGKCNNEIRKKIGIVFQKSYLDDMLTVYENLLLRGSLYGLSNRALQQAVERLCGPLGLQEFLHRRYGRLSGGQRRRADIARALINTPEILFLDEPTTGLDPASRLAIWQIVRTMQRVEGTTVLLTTHYMEEAAEADYTIVMGHGRVLAKGTPPALKEAYTTDVLRIKPSSLSAFSSFCQKAGYPLRQNGPVCEFPLQKTMDALPLLEQCRPYMESFEVLQGSMDEAFLNIIHGEAQEAAQ